MYLVSWNGMRFHNEVMRSETVCASEAILQVADGASTTCPGRPFSHPAIGKRLATRGYGLEIHNKFMYRLCGHTR